MPSNLENISAFINESKNEELDDLFSEQSDRAIALYINDISKRLKNITHKRIDSKNSAVGTSQCTMAILDSLSEHDNVTELMLCRSIKYSAATVSVAIKKMANENLLALTVDPNDRRRTLIAITQKGLETQSYLEESYKNLDNLLLKGITESEKKLMLSVLKKMLKNILEVRGGSESSGAKNPPALNMRTIKSLLAKK